VLESPLRLDRATGADPVRNACRDSYGSFAFAFDYDLGRSFPVKRLNKLAINNNPLRAYVARHVFGMPGRFDR
jgi:hypothetical protein